MLVLLCSTCAIEPRPVVNLMHIPKTSGTSFYNTNQKVLKFTGVSPGENERCYQYVAAKNNHPVITFLRKPRAHLLSQYIFCRYSRWGKSVSRKNKFWSTYDRDDSLAFDQWLRSSSSPEGRKTRCYYPYNMQTRFLTCQKMGHYYIHEHMYNAHSALKNLRKTIFGITEHFRESMCLVKFTLGLWIPLYCQCKYKHTFRETHERHNAPRYSMNLILDKTNDLVTEHTEHDEKLYTMAVLLFRERVNKMEDTLGIKVFC